METWCASDQELIILQEWKSNFINQNLRNHILFWNNQTYQNTIDIQDSLDFACHVCGGGCKQIYKRPKNHRIYKSLHPLNIGYGDNNFDHVNIFHNIVKSNFVSCCWSSHYVCLKSIFTLMEFQAKPMEIKSYSRILKNCYRCQKILEQSRTTLPQNFLDSRKWLTKVWIL